MAKPEIPQSEAASPADATADAGTGDGEPGAEDNAGSSRGGRSFLTEMVVLFAVALTIALLIKSFVVQPFFIPSGSMENTLLIGDKVLVNKLVYHLRPIERGDIVVFNGSGSWDSPSASGPVASNPVARVYDDTLGALFRSVAGLFGTSADQIDYIKRVIGVPGDHVVCCNAHGQVTVNGVPLQETSYLYPGDQPSQFPFNVVVPPGRLWVMGDHRIDSADSRYHDCAYRDTEYCYSFDRDGTIPENKVIGRAFMIVWPPSRIRILPIPATFEQVQLLQPSARHSPASASGVAALVSSGNGIPVRPSSPYLPIALGFGFAVPLTAGERRLRLRLRARRKLRQSRGRAVLFRRGRCER
jgi:signal peptidase I